MSRLLAHAARRFYLRHPWQLALAIAGISLGVAVYVGVDLANDSARRAFELSTEIVRGRTSHRLLPVGAALPESVYSALLTERRVQLAAPIIEIPVRIGGPAGLRQPLLGVDPVKELAFRDYSGFVPGRGSDPTRLVTQPGSVLIPETLAVDLSLTPGSRLDLWIDGRRRTVEVVGTVQSLAANAEAAPPIITDISTAQELIEQPGSITRIDLSLTAEQARRLSVSPPAGTTLVAAADQTRELTEMTSAFQTNLTALGLLALVVGMFLIYATMSFAIVQRRAVIGVLRAIGIDQRALLGNVLLEAMAIGALGTAIGLVLGNLLASGLVDMVLQTIGDLYFSVAVAPAAPSAWIYVQGAVLGLGATLVAAIGPALDASRSEPDSAMRRATLERQARRRSTLAAVWAVPTLALAGLLLAMESEGLVIAFAALFFVLCAGAMLTPAATALLMKLCEPLVDRCVGLPGLMAVRGVSASLSRTGVATAALAVAVATVIGIGLMITSFRASLVTWLDTTLTAEVYLSLDPTRQGNLVGAEEIAAIEALDEVRGISLSRYIRLPTEMGELGVRAAEPGPDGWGLDIVSGNQAESLTRLGNSPSIVVSEPVSYRFGLDVGDTVTLPTINGDQAFTIAGVFRDYNTGGYAFVMSIATYRRYWRDDTFTGLGVHLDPSVTEDAAIDAIRSTLAADAELRFRSTEAIERISLAVFDRTFKITEVLRLLAGFVAFLGVLSAVLAIELERARERAVLRALGFSPRELGTLVLTQTGLLGVAAGLAAVPLGAALAAILVYVINQRSFGWSMDMILTPAPILLGLTLAVTAALLAGIYPAIYSSRSNLQVALLDE